jgi:hypothetical protein
MDPMIPMIARARLPYSVIVAAFAVLVAGALAISGCTRGNGRSAGAGGQSNAQTGSDGTLTGRITRGPTLWEGEPGAPFSAAPVAGGELKIRDLNGAVVATARTDDGGLYRVTLPPGNYRAERGTGFPGAARNLPAIVSISPGEQTRLDIWVDGRIRASGQSLPTPSGADVPLRPPAKPRVQRPAPTG